MGSLWFAAVLMTLLMAAMASATVFESINGTEMALADFYYSPWFNLLLVLFAANVLCAALARYPYSRGHIGFLLTHGGLLLVLGGALVTEQWAVNGQLGILEGENAAEFRVREDTFTVTRSSDGARATVGLPSSIFSGFSTVENPSIDSLKLEGLESIEVLRYLPDAVSRDEVLNDSDHFSPAVEVSLVVQGHDHPVWIFDGQSTSLESVATVFRAVNDAAELERLILPPEDTSSSSKGTVKVSFGDSTQEFSLEECTEQAVPVGDTGLTLQVMQYYPHAIVGENNEVRNASANPVNPAVEFEVKGQVGTERRLAFAKYPDFKSMHGDTTGIEGLEVVFTASAASGPAAAPIQLFVGPTGEMHVVFTASVGAPVHQRIEPGSSVETPWPGRVLSLHRYFPNARGSSTVEVPDPLRQNRVPALKLLVSAGGESQEVWVQKQRSRTIPFGGQNFEILFGDKSVPLGFTVGLNRFHLGTYPGGNRPRSFESHITITDPATGGAKDRIVSMNNPVEHGGYTFFQSSYREQGDRWVTFLQVSRDPGVPVVFAGYVVTTLGMLVVLGTRIRKRMMMQRSGALGSVGGGW